MPSIKSLKLLLFGIITFIISSTNAGCPEPYSHCNAGKPGFVNVHLVPHTHDDVGWLKTVDQYYYGSNNGQAIGSVQYILDTVIEELQKDPLRRFVYAEIAFFWRWWNEQDDNTKKIVRTLVNEGRLEFVIGAWCMNDEATTYYTDIIDQQTLGLKFIQKEFGECARPRAAWQVDPFGHSREQASLFAQFGFDGLFLGRIDNQDFDYRGQTKTREMLWQASANLDNHGQLFTGVLPNEYGSPPNFCFDSLCGSKDDPFMDDPELDDYNVKEKVDDFLAYTKSQLEVYKTKNLIMTMGGDFQYSNARMQFKNLDKLIKYVNQRQLNGSSNVNIFYSTTACYLNSLNRENTTWTVKTDDFFPYSQRKHSFWTGYYTSRPSVKNYVKQASNFLQVVRHVGVLTNYDDKAHLQLNLERTMGVLQHHDAVSGTERQHVANDYVKRLSIGFEKGVELIYSALSNGNNIEADNKKSICDVSGGPGFCYCSKLNISECIPIQNSDELALTVFNPLAKNLSSWLKIPVVHDDYSVWDIDGMTRIECDIIEVKQNTKNVPERNSTANYELFFQSNIGPLDRRIYIIRNNSEANDKSAGDKASGLRSANEISLKNDHLELIFDSNGNLIKMHNLDSKISTNLTQQFSFYDSHIGNNSEAEFQASGAYIFRPRSDKPTYLSVKNFKVYHGRLFNEIHQVYNDWTSQTIRLYKDDSKNVEFNWQVGPIDIDDGIGKEVILLFSSDLKSDSKFYTDSNGREILERKRDLRPTWKFNQSEKVSGNYYPVNSRIFLRDTIGKKQITLVTDRSQGGSSVEDGSLELMVHRRILHDDALGVGEILNEKGIDGKGLVVKGTTYLIFDTIAKSAELHRNLAHEVNNKPVLFFDPDIQTSKNKLQSGYVKQNLSSSQFELPPNLHLLTLTKDYESPEKKILIIRVEHFYEKDEDAFLSKPALFDLSRFFARFNVIDVQELALGANIPVEELNHRLKWNVEITKDQSNLKDFKEHRNGKNFTYEFKPMQIRTFRVQVDY